MKGPGLLLMRRYIDRVARMMSISWLRQVPLLTRSTLFDILELLPNRQANWQTGPIR